MAEKSAQNGLQQQSAFRSIVDQKINQENSARQDRELEFDPEECPLREEEHIRYTEKNKQKKLLWKIFQKKHLLLKDNLVKISGIINTSSSCHILT